MKLFNTIINAISNGFESHTLQARDELRFSLPGNMDAVKTEIRWFNGQHDLDTRVTCQLL
ncbi:MAG: hypothetical protein E7317_04565 [Clostridiales bacterium]|nr:hypothetical protein [Clostridiales bacterium]